MLGVGIFDLLGKRECPGAASSTSFNEASRRENFIHRRKRRAGFRSAGDHVDRAADYRDGEAVAGGGHRGPGAPLVVRRIEGLGVIMCSAT